MVEINNQRKAFLDKGVMRELITDAENQKSWLWRHCRRRAIYRLLRSPSQTCHAKPKTQINRRRTLPASSRWWDAYRKQLGLKDFLSEKSGRWWHCSRLRSVALYLWLIVVISVRQSTVAAISGLRLPGAGWWSFEHKADSLIAKFKEAGGTVREIDDEQSHHGHYLCLWLVCIIARRWLLIINDNRYYLQSPARTKMPENWSCERGN